MEKKIEIKAIKNVSEKIGGKLYIPKGKGPFPAVVFFHGSGGTGNTNFETAKLLSKHGILGFAFNFQGVGLSGGKFEDQTVMKGTSDGVAAIGYLEFDVPEADMNRIGFVGSSYGGYVSSVLSGLSGISGNKKQIAKSMVLIAPAAYPKSAENNQRDADSNLDGNYEESLSYEMIRKFKGDLQVQICEKDDVVPQEISEKYYSEAKNARRKELYVIKGAKHWLGGQPKQKKVSQDKIIDWFKKTL